MTGPIVGKIPHPDNATVPSKWRVFLTPSMVLAELTTVAWAGLGAWKVIPVWWKYLFG